MLKLPTTRRGTFARTDHAPNDETPKLRFHNAAERDKARRIWTMRQTGSTYREIAETFGISLATAAVISHKVEREVIIACGVFGRPVRSELIYGLNHVFTPEGRVTRV